MEGKKIKDSLVTLAQVMIPEDANPAGNVHGGRSPRPLQCGDCLHRSAGFS
jgi:acyl-CoA hydrolase